MHDHRENKQNSKQTKRLVKFKKQSKNIRKQLKKYQQTCGLRSIIRYYYRQQSLENMSELNTKFQIIQDQVGILAEEEGTDEELSCRGEME